MNKITFGGVNVKNVINTIKGGQRGVNVVSFVSMDKKLPAAHKDMMGRIWKVVMWLDRPLVSYEGSVNAKADSDFTAKPLRGFVWTQYPYFKKAIKSGIEYLTLNFRECDRSEYKEVYFIDGVVVDKSKVTPYLKEEKKYAPKTQIAVGVTEKKEFTQVVQYEIENVAYIGTSKADAIGVFERCQQ